MALSDTELLELKKHVALGLNNLRLYEKGDVVIVALESLFQSVDEKKSELAGIETEIAKLNNSILSARGKLKEAQDDAKAILSAAHEEYDSVISKAKSESDKIKSTAIEKADKEYAKLVKPLEDKVAKYDALIAEKDSAATEAKQLIEANKLMKVELEKDQAKLDSVKLELAKILGVGS